MKRNSNRFEIFVGGVHLLNGGASSFKAAAPTREKAKELAEEIAKSEKAMFYRWLHILDSEAGRVVCYSIKLGRVLEERKVLSCHGRVAS
ncbi:hypothetical protein [Microbulbifer variabilis]|uniref:hypothetical protein n=1 Tax=Microbulbifer variabilis TaxID=266805 RepID=UPI001CFE4C17|nr:hypothetical protein [Microbulbifer variabilis]